MNTEELLNEISRTLTKHKVQKLSALASEGDVSVADLIEISFYHKSEIAFRAAWILEYVFQNSPLRFRPHLDLFLGAYPNQSNHSCQRHYTKILMSPLTQSWLENFSDELLEPLIDATFGWLIDEKVPVAVKVNCLDILYRFGKRYAWIKEELKPQIELLMKNGSAAMQSRGKSILAKLEGKARTSR